MPRMKERFARLALVIGFGMSAVSAGAQDYSSLLQEATVTEGRLFQVRPDAQASWAVPVTVRVPVFGDNTPPPRFGVLLDDAPPDGGALTVTFQTPEGALIEAVNLSSATIPTDLPAKRRVEVFAVLLQQRVLPKIVAALPGATSDGLRPTEVAGFDGVEMLGRATHPDHGPIRWRLVGIPHPERAESVYAFVQVATDRLPLPEANDFARSLTGRLLTSLQFQ